MSTLALAPCTLIFTGADLASVHEQIAKYYTEKALAAPAPASAPVAPALFPYEKGMVKLLAQEDMPAAAWPAYCELRDYGNSMPPKIAVVAHELAAKHFPAHQELAAEYIYLRYLMGTSCAMWGYSWRLEQALKGAGSQLHPNELLIIPTTDNHIFNPILPDLEKRLHHTAAKLVKAGWKSHTNFNFAGTEFQKLAIICSKREVDDDCCAGGTLRADLLDKELTKL